MTQHSFISRLQSEVLVFDGAMGTVLQSASEGLTCPELFVLKKPELIESIHRSYIEAGSQIIQTNTFGGNRLKLANYGLGNLVNEINTQAVHLAHKASAGRCFVAGSIGPSGKLLAPISSATFDELYSAFSEQAQALIKGNVDLIHIETMSDIHEAKIAVIAVKDIDPHIPVICSMTFDEHLRTLTGSDPETVATVLESLGVTVIGVNCGTGPTQATAVLSRLYHTTDLPLLAKPNAGVPRLLNGKTVFDLSPKKMAGLVPQLIAAGASIVGGCCGTTYAHLCEIKNAAESLRPLPRNSAQFSKLASGTKAVLIGESLPLCVVGERINPTARKHLSVALQAANYDVVADEARAQAAQGATVIDVNVGIAQGGRPATELMQQSILAIQQAVDLPLSIDTTSPAVMEAALKVYRGKALLNSTDGDEEKLAAVLSLAKRYGAAIVGLTLDASGIPLRAQERIRVAKRIVDRALSYGLRKEDIYIDGLTLTAGADQKHALEALEVVRIVKQELKVRTILGTSNVSHGLPHRPHLNNAFLAMAMAQGLDAAILNPAQEGVWNTLAAAEVLTGRDINAQRYVEHAQSNVNHAALFKLDKQSPDNDLATEILHGRKTRVTALVESLLNARLSQVDIVMQHIVPAIEEAGSNYEQGIFFLPQLLLSAEAVQTAFLALECHVDATERAMQHTVVLATVKGDIHDVGKNIVGLLLKAHGFRVIDLGKDVDADRIIDAAIEHNADIIALSALMTTTMPQMEIVAARLSKECLAFPLLLGGAVVTAEYAQSIGSYYAADAVAAVRVAKAIIERKEATTQ